MTDCSNCWCKSICFWSWRRQSATSAGIQLLKTFKNWKSEIIPLAADNCDKDVAMFAAYKIYIIVNISEDDGDYFVIFKSAVEWSKEWSVWKQFRVAKCYLCYVSTKRSNQSVFSRIRERGSESDSKYVCSNPPHENTYRCLPVNS